MVLCGIHHISFSLFTENVKEEGAEEIRKRVRAGQVNTVSRLRLCLTEAAPGARDCRGLP